MNLKTVIPAILFVIETIVNYYLWLPAIDKAMVIFYIFANCSVYIGMKIDLRTKKIADIFDLLFTIIQFINSMLMSFFTFNDFVSWIIFLDVLLLLPLISAKSEAKQK